MAHLTDLDLTAPADSLFSGGTVLNTWRTRIDVLNDALGDITTAEADQVEAIGTTTISAAQWAYLGALDQSIISTASVDFGEVDITKTTTLAAGGFGLRSQVTHSTTGMTGTLRGAYIVATNAAFTATGTIRGAEIKARAATSGLVGGNVTTLEGVSISSDAKNKTVTTQRGMEVILDGQSGAAVTLGVGIRIANNYQADIATTSYALQIYRDSFDYTADIQLSGGGLIGGSTGKIKMDSSGVTTLTASGNLDIGAYTFRCAGLIDDTLTSGRVVFASTNGLLADAAAMTFVTDTLTVTKLGAFQAAGAINFDSQNMTNVDIDSGTINGITDLAVADGGTGSSTAENARTALGLVIGTNVQAYDATLLSIAALGTAADKLLYTTNVDTWAEASITSFARGILDDTTEAIFKATVNLEIGTDVLAYDAGLSNLAGIAMAADKFYYTSADNTHVAGTVTAFARTILDDADAATQLGTLGLSTNLPNLADAEVTQLEAIGAATISAGQWGYLGACTAGGGQLLAALTEAESTQVEAIGAATISATQWGYLGALTTHPLGGDATAGRVLRGISVTIDNGTDASTLKCTVASLWNGDTIAETDNIAKGATTGDFFLSAGGLYVRILASGLTGNAIFSFGSITENRSGTDLTTSYTASANNITFRFYNTSAGTNLDSTVLVDTGVIIINLIYITDA